MTTSDFIGKFKMFADSPNGTKNCSSRKCVLIGSKGWLTIASLTLLCIFFQLGCIEQSIEVEIYEDGSAVIRQSLLADAPVHALLRRNPEFATIIYTAMAGTQDEVGLDKIKEISRGKWEGLASEIYYPTLMSLQNNRLLSVQRTETNDTSYSIRILPGVSNDTTEAMKYPADPTFIDAIWDTVFTNGPSLDVVLSRGLLRDLKMDYTLVVPGELVDTNGKQDGVYALQWSKDGKPRLHLIKKRDNDLIIYCHSNTANFLPKNRDWQTKPNPVDRTLKLTWKPTKQTLRPILRLYGAAAICDYSFNLKNVNIP